MAGGAGAGGMAGRAGGLGGANGVVLGGVGFADDDGTFGGAFGFGGATGVLGGGGFGATGGVSGVVPAGVPGTAGPGASAPVTGSRFVGNDGKAFVTNGAGSWPGPAPPKPLSRPVGVRFVPNVGNTGPINCEFAGVAGALVSPMAFNRFVAPAGTFAPRRFVVLPTKKSVDSRLTTFGAGAKRLVEKGTMTSTP